MSITDVCVDLFTWELDSEGNLVPRAQILDTNYPSENNVRLNVTYGEQDQFTGSYAGGGGAVPDKPTLSILDNKDGNTATATISGSTEGTTTTVYAFLSHGGVLDYIVMGSREGDGNVSLNGGVASYIGFAISEDSGVYSLPSDVISFSISSPRSYIIRDNTARAAVHALMHSREGEQIIFQNGADAAPITIWAKIDTGDQAIRIRDKARVGELSLNFTVPRQTGFPPGELPDSFLPTATIEYKNEIYELDKITPNSGVPDLSAVFTIKASKSKSGNY